MKGWAKMDFEAKAAIKVQNELIDMYLRRLSEALKRKDYESVGMLQNKIAEKHKRIESIIKENEE